MFRRAHAKLRNSFRTRTRPVPAVGATSQMPQGVGPFVAYVLSRTVGVPGDPGDVGNWGYWVGTVSLLAQHPASGDDLLKKFQRPKGNVWPASQSQKG